MVSTLRTSRGSKAHAAPPARCSPSPCAVIRFTDRRKGPCIHSHLVTAQKHDHLHQPANLDTPSYFHIPAFLHSNSSPERTRGRVPSPVHCRTPSYPPKTCPILQRPDNSRQFNCPRKRQGTTAGESLPAPPPFSPQKSCRRYAQR